MAKKSKKTKKTKKSNNVVIDDLVLFELLEKAKPDLIKALKFSLANGDQSKIWLTVDLLDYIEGTKFISKLERGSIYGSALVVSDIEESFKGPKMNNNKYLNRLSVERFEVHVYSDDCFSLDLKVTARVRDFGNLIILS